MNNEIIPFGKLKGKPVFALAENKSYTDWLLGQPWFKEQHLNIYNVVINNFRTTDDTPEHNAIQIRFLDQEYSARLAYFLYPGLFYWNSENINKELEKILSEPNDDKDELKTKIKEMNNTKLLQISTPELEGGYDVAFTAKYGLELKLDPKLSKSWVTMQPSYSKYRYTKIFIEIKPTIGDDYPAVLRQMKASMPVEQGHTEQNRAFYCLLLRDYIGKSASKDQFVKYFESQKYRVVFMSDIESVSLPVGEEFFKSEISEQNQ